MDHGPGRKGLDYFHCRYGGCQITFRGPAASLDGDYVVVLGGSEVYGPFVEDPFVEQVADRWRGNVVNLGVMNGGLDVFARDPALREIVAGAGTVVVQALGAHNLSNRYYSVHPRRNDRFLRPSIRLARLYPDVDFTAFGFTRHMLTGLSARCPERYEQVVEELRIAWRARVSELFDGLPGVRILLSVEDRHDRSLGADPILVSDGMIADIGAGLHQVVRCDVTAAMANPDRAGMIYSEHERPRAERSLTPGAHTLVATALNEAFAKRGGLAA